MVLSMVIVCIECLYFRKSTHRLSFPFGFLCANIGLSYLLEVITVMMPYLCSRASSTKISFFEANWRLKALAISRLVI